MNLKDLGTLLFLLQSACLSSAINHHDLIHENVRRASSISYPGYKVPSYNFSMPVDHFNNTGNQTYNNRYWVNDTYWKPGGPVFFLDGGESGISDQVATQRMAEINRTSAVIRLAQRYNGIAILWEHRYYGLSMPIPLNRSTHIPQGSGLVGYRYLNVEQALEDVVYFAKNWKPNGCSGDECAAVSPSKVPWIWVGGSYPGIRGALIRIRNPEIFYASWASSAPVQAMIDGSVYYAPIAASLPQNCSEDVRAAVKYADEIMSGNLNGSTYKQLQSLVQVTLDTQFGLNRTEYLSRASTWTTYTIGRLMASVLTADFQANGPSNNTHRFCNYLESYNPNGKPSNTSNPYISILSNPGDGQITDKGIAATYNSTVALQAYFYAHRRWYEQFFKDLVSRFATQAPPDIQADQLAWLYQVFTQFGWYQASNPQNITIVSKYFNITAQRAYVPEFNYGATASRDLPKQPDINAFNKYGGWNMTPSNVMFTDGSFDPWRGGTPMSEQLWNGAPLRQVTQTVPACGKPPPGSDVFGLVYPGSVHVPDLETPIKATYNASSPVYQGVELFSKALDTWLQCFNGTS